MSSYCGACVFLRSCEIYIRRFSLKINNSKLYRCSQSKIQLRDDNKAFYRLCLGLVYFGDIKQTFKILESTFWLG